MRAENVSSPSARPVNGSFPNVATTVAAAASACPNNYNEGLAKKASLATELFEKTLSASVGALITSVVVTPLDVIKVRMQAEPASSSSNGSRSFASRSAPHWGPNSYIFCNRFYDHGKYACGCRTLYVFEGAPRSFIALPIRGTLDGVLKISRVEGLTGLWRGLSPTLLMSIPATVVYLLGYEAIRESLKDVQPMQKFFGAERLEGWMAPLVAGSTARILAVSLISPIELFKTKMQHRGLQGSIPAVARDIWRDVCTRGVGALYRGLVPTLWRDVPFSALYWMGFEGFRRSYQRLIPEFREGSRSASKSFALSFMAGASSGMIAAALTTPFDVAKTRQQVGSHAHNHNRRLDPARKGIVRHLLDIWRDEGFGGLTRGIIPRICRVAPSCAIMVGSYEFGKAYLHSQRS